MRIAITLVGEAELKKRLRELERLYPQATAAALYQEGMVLWRDAVKRAPVEFGVMRNSAYVSPPMKQGREVVIEVGFGTKYAVYQHERKELQHPRGGEAGYLKKAADQVATGFLARLAARIEQNVKRNVKSVVVQAPTQPRAALKSRTARRLRAARRRR